MGLSGQPFVAWIAAAVAVLAAIGGFLFVRNLMGGSDLTDTFVAIPGIEYTEPPEEQVEMMRSMLDAVPMGDQLEFEVRMFTNNDAPGGAVIAFGVDPSLMRGQFRSQFVGGFESTSGVKLQPNNVGRLPGLRYSGPQGTFVVFFDETEGRVVMVTTPDRALADRVASAIASR